MKSVFLAPALFATALLPPTPGRGGGISVMLVVSCSQLVLLSLPFFLRLHPLKAKQLAILVTFLLACLVEHLARADGADGTQFFESKIRPVLIKHCYECHSEESDQPSGNLLLDSAAGLVRGGDSGPAIEKGKPNESLLIDAMRYELLEMPPSGRLPDHVVRDFERWVETGADDPRGDVERLGNGAPRTEFDVEAGRSFWAFQPIGRPAAPKVENVDWPATDLDAFVLAKLESAGLAPAPDADRRTLIRRLYFDLTGLPPTPEDVAAWLKDDSEDAYEELANRLLASKQFGVHWGRRWLDAARYADSNGSDFNATFHNAWRYRDYIIDAFNDDKPFDQFVREQIAGDLLPSSCDEQRTEQIVATGFLMLGTKMLSERDKAKLTMDVVDEQINTVGQAFIGLTLGCARCHDHKFDPIPTRDYYALAGIFRSTRTLQGESQQYVSTWPRRSLPASEAHIAAVREHKKTTKELLTKIEQTTAQRTQLAANVKTIRAGLVAMTIDDDAARLVGAWKRSTYHPTFVGEGYIHDDDDEKGKKYVEFAADVERDATYEVQLAYTPGGNRANNVPVSIRHADGDAEITVDQRIRPPIEERFASLGRFTFVRGRPATIKVATHGTTGHVIVDAVRLLELDDAGKPVRRFPTPSSELIEIAQRDLDRADATLEKLKSLLEEMEASAPPPLPRAIAVDEADEIVDCQICIRGEHRNLGPTEPRGVLQVLAGDDPPLFSDRASGRLELANWIASDQHPLTARVFVNRVWHHLMGQGIVASVDNFGHLGDRPTHPELLDRLAADFIDCGWSVKRTVRQIVLSRTYRMSSRHDERSWTNDPANRLLWRAHRRRLAAESIRDSMLAISGQLDLTPGGSPVEGFGTLVTQNDANQQQFQLKDSLHRSVYLPIIRGELPAMLTVFDFADPDLVTGRRSVTNVPAQSLFLMNSPFVLEQAEKAAERIRSQNGTGADLESHVTKAYELVLSRPANDLEVRRAEAFIRAAQPTYAGMSPLAQLVHALLASTEFRMLN